MIIAIISYIAGCLLCYFTWYKNGLLLHYLIIILIIGSYGAVISIFKENSSAFSIIRYKTLTILLLISLFTGVAGWVFSLEKRRVNSILENDATKQAVANVITIDLRSTRTGKQAWSIINYTVNNQIIEQSFADTSKNLTVGKKYLVAYSVEHPDMFRILKELK